MIITRNYALKLVREGKATIHSGTTLDGVKYDIVDRYDLQRTDHCLAVS